MGRKKENILGLKMGGGEWPFYESSCEDGLKIFATEIILRTLTYKINSKFVYQLNLTFPKSVLLIKIVFWCSLNKMK